MKEKISNRAKQILSNQKQLGQLISKAQAKANRTQKQFKAVKSDWNIFLRMLKAWKTGKYRKIPYTTLLSSIVTLLYFLNPFDVIPDFIPMNGLVDDLAMIGILFRSIHGDLDKFTRWERRKK